jgi:DNA polymerase
MAGAGPQLSGRQKVALEAMAIDVWTPRIEFMTPQAQAQAPAPATAADEWGALEREALACTNCVLHQTRTRVVFGVGDRQARWLVIGEAPGADEDRQGEPFVGRAGQLLNEMLRAAGLDREQVYIANILKCRPPENRDPKPEESARCEGYLQRQIALVQPGLVLAVGRIAAQNLLREDTPLSNLRGRVHRYGPAGIPLVVTYHPAYLLRSPGQKRKAWEDLCLAMATVPPLRSTAPAQAAIDER